MKGKGAYIALSIGLVLVASAVLYTWYMRRTRKEVAEANDLTTDEVEAMTDAEVRGMAKARWKRTQSHGTALVN